MWCATGDSNTNFYDLFRFISVRFMSLFEVQHIEISTIRAIKVSGFKGLVVLSENAKNDSF